ncbi:hypothetical protein P170DRAFT_481438 [Aspergillus steynii IBT 23096]|uniref:Uncharacterized protein n=1 Tax=Aspergillus steynii IBT 23096 TaxID=1392250 RepID=A0A2I2FQJ9_9EURO|nr:uncharacterized protein P170DRAFT_481438 [Aspergillus steynii IBT 23096]PLB42914.1 hypothetical protein P170DRAFT_481438 [Aspergillus steynii IBT 23096]
MALTRRPYLPASVFPLFPRVPSARQLVWRWATPGPFDQAPDHPRTFCPGTGPPRAFSVRRHPPRTFCPGTGPPRAFSVRRPPTPDLLPQAPDRPRAFCPGHHTPRTVLPRDLGRSHHVITPTRPPKAPSRANWSASGPLSRTSPLPARHHPPPCILPKPLRANWSGGGPPQVHSTRHQTTPGPPRAFSVRRPPAPDLLPQALARQEGHPQPGDARPGGHMRVRGQGRGPAEKIPVAVSRGAIHKSLPAGQLASTRPNRETARPAGRMGPLAANWLRLPPEEKDPQDPSEGISEARRRNSGLR